MTGYPDLAQKYRISSVPKTVIDEKREFVGAIGEAALLDHLKQAASAAASNLIV